MDHFNPKGNKPRIIIGRTVGEAEVSIFWPPDAKSRLIGKIEGKKEKGAAEDEMVR